MIKNILLITTLLSISTILSAQDDNPKIGSEKGVKEKLIRIKNGLPDIKKNLTVPSEIFVNTRHVKFDMGDGIILFEEDKEEGLQSLHISFSTTYFSGSIADFQNYYKTLVAMIKEVFGSGYYSETENEEKTWTTSFYQKGKDIFTSPIRIHIEFSWLLESLEEITIEIYSKVK